MGLNTKIVMIIKIGHNYFQMNQVSQGEISSPRKQNQNWFRLFASSSGNQTNVLVASYFQVEERRQSVQGGVVTVGERDK